METHLLGVRTIVDYKINLEKGKEKIIRCRSIWEGLSAEYNIDAKTLVVVLAGENAELDELAMKHLPMFIKRKKAERAVIWTCKEDTLQMAQGYSYDFPAHVSILAEESLLDVYDYYCYAFNLDNIAFTFLNHCPYNLLGRILDETSITEAEAVDLGVYWLRCVSNEEGKERQTYV
jgi:hypothetical protein